VCVLKEYGGECKNHYSGSYEGRSNWIVVVAVVMLRMALCFAELD
jgi:hypothetical protein